MKRRGFTVVELMVVLAITVVLAAILFAIVTKKRDDERRRRCASCRQNIRQIGLAIKQYLSDYDESFPPVSSGGIYYGWADIIEPYTRNTQLLQCGCDETFPLSTDGPATPNYTDYFYNSNLAGRNESDLKFIAATVMLGDSTPGDARQHSNGGKPIMNDIANLVNRYGQPIGAATRHLVGANYAFADGHVKWFKGKDANTTPAIRANASGGTNPTFGIE